MVGSDHSTLANAGLRVITDPMVLPVGKVRIAKSCANAQLFRSTLPMWNDTTQATNLREYGAPQKDSLLSYPNVERETVASYPWRDKDNTPLTPAKTGIEGESEIMEEGDTLNHPDTGEIDTVKWNNMWVRIHPYQVRIAKSCANAQLFRSTLPMWNDTTQATNLREYGAPQKDSLLSYPNVERETVASYPWRDKDNTPLTPAKTGIEGDFFFF